MSAEYLKSNYKNPIFLFAVGWCLVLMSGWIPVLIGLDTFTHFWRVEVAASFFLLVVLANLLYRNSDKFASFAVSRREINFVVLPILLFIVWSGLSIIWSPSWKSALYHTLIWSEYLVFYLLIRAVLSVRGSYAILLTLLTVVFLIIGLPAVIEYFGFLYLGGATTLGVRYAKYGEQINTFFPLLLVGVLSLRGRNFWLGLLALTALWLFLISSFGRINILLFVGGTIAVAALVFVFRRFHQYRRKMLFIGLALIVAPFPLHTLMLFAAENNTTVVDRINDSGANYSGNFRKLTASISGEMIKTHPLIGVGADNFGSQFNEYRKIYAAQNPSDVNLSVAETELAERSHNEFLQIAAELGAVGSLIFLWFLSSIGLMIFSALKNRRRVSLFPLAALLGAGLFLASSLVSSFSFRLMQNGFVFFFVLAVAAKYLLKSKSANQTAADQRFSAKSPAFACAGIAVCLLMLGWCAVRVTSAVYTLNASRTTEIERAKLLFETAFKLDDENADAHYLYGKRLLENKNYAEAAAQFRQTIDKQAATSPIFSYLAAAQTLSGDTDGAEKSFAEAVKLYPFSPFVRTRYALLLKANNQNAAAEQQLNFAFNLSRPQTVSWVNLMNDGVYAASQKSSGDPNIATIEELTPWQAVEAVTDEREILHPEEKSSTHIFNLAN